MLTRRLVTRRLPAVLVAAVLVLDGGTAAVLGGGTAALAFGGGTRALVLGTAALAEPIGSCPPDTLDCSIEDHTGGPRGGTNTGGAKPGGSTGGNTGKGSRECRRGTEKVPCYDDVYGWFNSSDGCYYGLAKPQPTNVPAGHAAYVLTCGGVVSPEGVVLANPPGGFEQRASPIELAYDAMATITLGEPVIKLAPDPGGAGLVGLPVWMWTPNTPVNWGPNTAAAAQAGLRVEITARVTRIDWDMGDGTTVTCTTPGTPYDESYGGQPSPDCGYAGYRTSSRNQPGGTYRVTATTTWTVDYTSSAGSGTLDPVVRESTTAVRIDELQVVTR